jgi:hypothetical protein
MDKADSVVRAICEKFLQRSAVGRAKYGTDLDRTDLSPLDWIQHAQEEHMDAILYLEKLKRVLQEKDEKLDKSLQVGSQNIRFDN